MKVLLDTNILLRVASPAHSMHKAARDAVAKLQRQGDDLVLVPQVIYEYWVVATRPLASNGLELTTSIASKAVDDFSSIFQLLRDERGIYPIWKELVFASGVMGKNAHDTRLVAAMLRHDIKSLLTFNSADFKRFAQIEAVQPRDV